MTTKPEKILVESVRVDESIYPRAAVSWRKVAEYKLATISGARFPPVAIADVEGIGKDVLIDGRHRLEVAKVLGAPLIEAVRLGALSVAEAILKATELNTKHGLPLSRLDRATLIQKLTVQSVQVEKIAAVLHVPVREVVRIAARMPPQPSAGGPREAAEIRMARKLLEVLREGTYDKTPDLIGILHELGDEIGKTVAVAA